LQPDVQTVVVGRGLDAETFWGAVTLCPLAFVTVSSYWIDAAKAGIAKTSGLATKIGRMKCLIWGFPYKSVFMS
jgi:hypothetical protein